MNSAIFSDANYTFNGSYLVSFILLLTCLFIQCGMFTVYLDLFIGGGDTVALYMLIFF